MATPEERIQEIGLELPEPAAPAGSYVPTVRTGSLVYTSGQVPFVKGELRVLGKVGAEVDVDQAAEQARVCALNCLAALKAEVGELSRIARIVKLVVFVASAPDFYAQPKVANGASDLLSEIFGDAGRHARSAVGVAALPSNVPVEIEMIAELA